MTLLIHAILRFTTALITDLCFAIAPHLKVTPHQTLPSLRTVELYIPLRRLRMTSVAVPRFALPSQFPALGRLCFAISCGTMPSQPLFLTAFDRHAVAPPCITFPCRSAACGCPALPCPRNARLYPCNTTLSLIGYAAAILCKNLSSYTFASHHHTNPCQCYALPFTTVSCFPSAEQCCTSRRIADAGHGMLCIAVPSPRAVPSRSTYALSIQAMPWRSLLYRCHLHTVLIGFSIAFFCLTHLALVAQNHSLRRSANATSRLALICRRITGICLAIVRHCGAPLCPRNTFEAVLCRRKTVSCLAPAVPLLAIPCQGQDLSCCTIMSHDLLCHCCI